MKFEDLIKAKQPDGLITVEQLLERFVVKPKTDGSDEHRLSSTDIIKYLGGVDSYALARRASKWLKANGFYNVNDRWCWRVAFKGTPEAPQYIV